MPKYNTPNVKLGLVAVMSRAAVFVGQSGPKAFVVCGPKVSPPIDIPPHSGAVSRLSPQRPGMHIFAKGL